MWQVNRKHPSHFLSPWSKPASSSIRPASNLQLKVSLLDIRPAIWRRLLVPARIKLPVLHDVLQLSFGWTNSHLHAFRLEGESYQAVYPDDRGADFFGMGQASR